MAYDLEKYQNPLDVLHWRWQTARAALDSDKAPSRDADPYVWQAWRFMKEYRTCINDNDAISVSLKYKLVSDAYGWYNSRSGYKNYIEALSLCDDISFEEEADLLGIDKKTLEFYEALFFDIRPKKSNKTWLATHIIEPSQLEAMNGNVSAVFSWKLFAIYGGVDVVRAAWAYSQQSSKVSDFHRAAGFSQLVKNYGLAQYFRPVNKYTAPEITDAMLKTHDLELKREALNNQKAMQAENSNILANVLGSVKFTIPAHIEDLSQLEELDAREPRLIDVLEPPTEVKPLSIKDKADVRS